MKKTKNLLNEIDDVLLLGPGPSCVPPIVDEGLERVYERHRQTHRRLVQGLEDMGITMLVEPDYRLPMLNSVYVPVGVDDAQVRRELRTAYKIEIGPGLGPLAGKIWRFGLMGHCS